MVKSVKLTMIVASGIQGSSALQIWKKRVPHCSEAHDAGNECSDRVARPSKKTSAVVQQETTPIPKKFGTASKVPVGHIAWSSCYRFALPAMTCGFGMVLGPLQTGLCMLYHKHINSCSSSEDKPNLERMEGLIMGSSVTIAGFGVLFIIAASMVMYLHDDPVSVARASAEGYALLKGSSNELEVGQIAAAAAQKQLDAGLDYAVLKAGARAVEEYYAWQE